MTVDANNTPPLAMCAPSVHSFERGMDPWHKDAFPDEFKHAGKEGERHAGWFCIDGFGNQIGFIADGTVYHELEEKKPCQQ